MALTLEKLDRVRFPSPQRGRGVRGEGARTALPVSRVFRSFFTSSRFALSLSRILILFLSPFALALSPYLFSQSTGKTDSVYTLRLYEDLVMVDVVVTGKDGTPIKNLRQEDFKIFEDKIPQQIRTFDFEDLSRAIDATPRPAESTPIINLSQTSPAQLPKDALQNRRLMILMLDLSAMPPEDQIQAQQAAQSFIEKKLTPAE